MGLQNILNTLEDEFILNEEVETFAITYKKDGKELSATSTGNSAGDAKRNFLKTKQGKDIQVTNVVKSSEVDENNTTSNLDGGEGQPRTPQSFQQNTPTAADKRKEYQNATSSTGMGVVNLTSDYTRRKNEIFDRIGAQIDSLSEIKYTDYAGDETTTASKKINKSIAEVNRRLHEIDRLVSHAMRLKSESGLNQDVFWESTKSKFSKISERMLQIGNKLREFNT